MRNKAQANQLRNGLLRNNNIPIFGVNGQQYDVDEKYINDFAKENPKAMTRVNQGESLLEISASDYPSYISQTKQHQIKELKEGMFNEIEKIK